jgi:hypothetical protein
MHRYLHQSSLFFRTSPSWAWRTRGQTLFAAGLPFAGGERKERVMARQGDKKLRACSRGRLSLVLSKLAARDWSVGTENPTELISDRKISGCRRGSKCKGGGDAKRKSRRTGNRVPRGTSCKDTVTASWSSGKARRPPSSPNAVGGSRPSTPSKDRPADQDRHEVYVFSRSGSGGGGAGVCRERRGG